ncbi:SDR family oxidoreductase [Streptomyces niveus]|uniref:SDR family oxidoreductase n=1 Tax=Streptomyces niveus TaxID=193462 RepID=UPI0034281665
MPDDRTVNGRAAAVPDDPTARRAPGVALVTGATGAIGSAVARALAARGTRVAVGFRRDEAAGRALAAELPGALAVRVDVADPESVRACFREVTEAAGLVSVLVGAAGTLRDRPVVRMRDEDWDDVLRTNLTGMFHCVRHALPSMIAQRFGRIVCVGSVSGALGLPGQANYAAAKAGLLGLTRSVARENGRYGITANVVAPGLVESPLTAGLGAPARERFLGLSATGRYVTPEDVAGAVRFCVDSPAVTGQLINVDGGLY